MNLHKPEYIQTLKKIEENFKYNFNNIYPIYKPNDILQISTNRVDKILFFYAIQERYYKHLKGINESL